MTVILKKKDKPETELPVVTTLGVVKNPSDRGYAIIEVQVQGTKILKYDILDTAADKTQATLKANLHFKARVLAPLMVVGRA